jgi:hypothetical protein
MNLYLTEGQGYDKSCAQILTLADLHNLIIQWVSSAKAAGEANHPGAQHMLLDLA